MPYTDAEGEALRQENATQYRSQSMKSCFLP